MNGTIAKTLLACCLAAAPSLAQGQTPNTPNRSPARHVSGLPDGVGTIQYDPGAPADSLMNAPAPTSFVGNRFDTHLGGPLSPGTVTGVSWYQGALGTAGLGSSGFVRGGPLGSALTFGASPVAIASNAFNSISVSGPVGSVFFVGLQVPTATGSPGPWGNIGVRSASANSQGFHGMVRNFAGTVSNTLSNQNAMVRVSGNVIIPVELLEFEVQ